MATSQRALELDLDMEVEALQVNMLAEQDSRLISQRQVGALAGLMNQGLESNKRKVRIRVLQILAQGAVSQRYGVRIESTKNIPGEFASILIENLKVSDKDEWELSRYGRKLLLLAEERAKAELDKDTD